MSSQETIEHAHLDNMLTTGQLDLLKHILYDACDVSKNRNIFAWIEQKARDEGHCILLYLLVRNKIKSHPLYSPREFEQVLTLILYFFLRLAEDCVAARHVNGFVKSHELFAIFLDKVRKWLIPFESRVVVMPETQGSWMSLIKQSTPVEWPNVGQNFNGWPTIQRIVSLLVDLCKQQPVDSHVKTHWSWCMYSYLEWVETIHFGDIPREIVHTYATNETAAQLWRKQTRQSLLEMLKKTESWESLWSLHAQAWTRSPK